VRGGVILAVVVGIAVAIGAVVISNRDEPGGGPSTSSAATPGSSAPPISAAAPAPTVPSSPTSTLPAGSAATVVSTPRRIPTIDAAGDLDAQPSVAGAPTSAPGLYASFELGLERGATTGPVVGLTWPAQAVAGFDHYVVLRRTVPGSPDEVAVATQSDPTATTFVQDLGTAVDDGTSTVSFRTGVVDAGGNVVKVSTTLTVRLSWP
jgi:hypothetical protein